MLPKQFRLPGNQFQKVKSKGKSIHSPFFILLYNNHSLNDNNPNSTSRIGFIVSSKISKKATIRNKIKRLLRASTSPHLSLLPQNKDIILIAKKTIINKLTKDVSKAIKKTIIKIN